MKTNGGNDEDDELSNLTESSVLLLVEALVRFFLFFSLSQTHAETQVSKVESSQGYNSVPRKLFRDMT